MSDSVDYKLVRSEGSHRHLNSTCVKNTSILYLNQLVDTSGDRARQNCKNNPGDQLLAPIVKLDPAKGVVLTHLERQYCLTWFGVVEAAIRISVEIEGDILLEEYEEEPSVHS